jgi:hypothetical protein
MADPFSFLPGWLQSVIGGVAPQPLPGILGAYGGNQSVPGILNAYANPLPSAAPDLSGILAAYGNMPASTPNPSDTGGVSLTPWQGAADTPVSTPSLIGSQTPDSAVAGVTPPDAVGSLQTDPRATRSIIAGKVTTSGWQYPSDHNAGMGWRVYVTAPDGSRIGFGHMDPATTPPQGAPVNVGDYMGIYANPTNGHSTGPHLHVQEYDPTGQIVDPGTISPLTNGQIKSPYGNYDPLIHPKGHQGVDWVVRK